jgi:hypothetical protein
MRQCGNPKFSIVTRMMPIRLKISAIRHMKSNKGSNNLTRIRCDNRTKSLQFLHHSFPCRRRIGPEGFYRFWRLFTCNLKGKKNLHQSSTSYISAGVGRQAVERVILQQYPSRDRIRRRRLRSNEQKAEEDHTCASTCFFISASLAMRAARLASTLRLRSGANS